MNKAWFSCAALPLLVCCLQAASPVVAELPLPEKLYPGLDAMLRQAVQQSPRMVSQMLNLEVAENDRMAARAGLLPNLSASASWYKARETINYISGPNSQPGVPNNVTKTPFSVNLSQPLFYWGERKNNYRIGKIQEQIAQGDFREVYRLLGQEIRSSYLNLIVSKGQFARTRFYQQFSKDQMRIAEERFAKKLISEAEVAGARLVAEKADINAESLAFDFEAAKASLGRLSGTAPLTDEQIPDELPKIEYPEAQCDQLLATFLSLPELPTIVAENKRKEIEIADLRFANSRTAHRPKVYGVIAFTRDEQDNLYGPGTKYSTTSKYAGFSASWNLFDGFASKANANNARIRLQLQENAYAQLKEKVITDVQRQRKQIYFSARNMSIEDRALASGQGNFNNKQDEFKRGNLSDSELSQVRLGLFDVQAATYRARVDLLLKLTEFLGTLNEDPLLDLPSSSSR